MGHWLCRERRGQVTGTRMRFDPADWTVDFPRPMMAAATTPFAEGSGTDMVRVDAVYYHRDELGGLIWEGGAPIPLGQGTIGAVETSDAGFTAELAGATARLAGPVVEETSAECRAELGDRRCRVAMRGRRRLARVVACEGAGVTLDLAEPGPDGWGWGVLRWLEGPNCGLDSGIAASRGADLTLRAAPPFAVAAGTLVRVEEGCDKTIATCSARFGNAVNFRGEPYLPGMDLLTRYPGA